MTNPRISWKWKCKWQIKSGTAINWSKKVSLKSVPKRCFCRDDRRKEQRERLVEPRETNRSNRGGPSWRRSRWPRVLGEWRRGELRCRPSGWSLSDQRWMGWGQNRNFADGRALALIYVGEFGFGFPLALLLPEILPLKFIRLLSAGAVYQWCVAAARNYENDFFRFVLHNWYFSSYISMVRKRHLKCSLQNKRRVVS